MSAAPEWPAARRRPSSVRQVSRGTEVGHADATHSHHNGYELDSAMTSCLTNDLRSDFTSIGGSTWRAASSNVHHDESNHWDVTFHHCGC